MILFCTLQVVLIQWKGLQQMNHSLKRLSYLTLWTPIIAPKGFEMRVPWDLSPFVLTEPVESLNYFKLSLASVLLTPCLLYTSPSPRDLSTSRMPSSA